MIIYCKLLLGTATEGLRCVGQGSKGSKPVFKENAKVKGQLITAVIVTCMVIIVNFN